MQKIKQEIKFAYLPEANDLNNVKSPEELGGQKKEKAELIFHASTFDYQP